MAILTTAEILARRRGEETVTLPGGGDVRIRALSRDDIIAAGELAQGEGGARDDYIVSCSLLEPVMSPSEVSEWGKNGAAGDLVFLTEQIRDLSHLQEGAGKSRVPRPGKRS